MKLILASKNQHKLLELDAILRQLGMEVALESEYGIDLDVEETGTTFEQNSYLKAKAVFDATGCPPITHDTNHIDHALPAHTNNKSPPYDVRHDLCRASGRAEEQNLSPRPCAA